LPVIPTGWAGFKATRVFRCVTYHISVKRAGKGNAVALMVDDKLIEGNMVPLPPSDRTEVKVEVALT